MFPSVAHRLAAADQIRLKLSTCKEVWRLSHKLDECSGSHTPCKNNMNTKSNMKTKYNNTRRREKKLQLVFLC